MKMKQLLRYTTSLLRTALLLGTMILINITGQAQTAVQWAEMPDAFETMDPASIIGDGNYYYIQFYQLTHIQCSYLTDCGVSQKAMTKDFLPYANNRLWTLVRVDDNDNTKFKLRSKAGNYLSFGSYGNQQRVICVNSPENASILQVNSLGTGVGDGYDISTVANPNFPMFRNGATVDNKFIPNEWDELPYNVSRRGGYSDATRMRFAKLKSTAAFIIYYRGEADGDAGNAAPTLATTRHYLTSSGTDPKSLHNEWNFRESEVSSRRSIIPSDKPLCTLPTLAAYHQDGLWTLEGTGKDGEFYIKKYGTEEYLNPVNNGFYYSDLGTKDEINGKYVLQDLLANRYTLVRNKMYSEDRLTSTMFNSIEVFNVDNGSTLNAGDLVVGTSGVDYRYYADLTGYTKMLIKGQENMQLRVLMNRQEGNGYMVERDVTIGSNGTAVVDLTGCNVGQGTVKMTYVDFNNPDIPKNEISAGNTAMSGCNKISGGQVGLYNSSWGVNYITYLQVDAHAIPGKISKVTLKAEVSGSADNKRNTTWGVGYNSSEWSSNLTWNTADRSITTLGTEVSTTFEKNYQYFSTTYEEKTFDITSAVTNDADKIVTILVYEKEGGGGYIKNPRVYVEYEPNDANTRYVHVNAIKTNWSSPTGSISSITMQNENIENTSNPRYLDHAIDDGWQVLQWDWNSGDPNNDWWYAGFYPVEVPVPNKDDYFQVLVKWGSNMINHNGGVTSPCPTDPADYELWQLEMVDDYLHFRLKAPNGGYLKPGGAGVTAPNDPTDAEILPNAKFFNETSNDFSLTWIYIDPTSVPKEIVVDKMVTHKKSYLQDYAQEGLDKQGLATDADDDWWNYDNSTQKVNHFEITHYVKKGNTITVEFPTVLNKNNDHIYYQRFYNYDEADASMDLDNLKAHVSLDTRDDGDVQYFLYKNGMVTGQKLDWTYNDGTDIPDGGMARNALRRFNFTNSDGNAFTVAADVSRYSDIRYWKPTAHLDGDLEEPSLTMRYIYKMKDAKEIAADLSTYTEISGVTYPDKVWKEDFTGDENAFLNDDNWKESKVFHFPAKPVAYENAKLVGYRGEFIGLKHVFSDYWVFDGNGTGDDNLVSAVNNASEGKIEVRIYDPNETGIKLGGWNPTVSNLKSTNDNGDPDKYEGFYFYDKMAPSVKTSYGDSRFVVFRYPDGGVADNKTGKDNKAYIHVYLNNNGTRYQLAQFTLIFDKGAETIPYTSVNGSSYVKADGTNHQYTDRDPNRLRKMAGRPIAKITFDYPSGKTYHYPVNSYTRHDGGDQNVDQDGVLHYYVQEDEQWVEQTRPAIIDNSSPVPLVFDNTNYAFDGDGCNWGSYALVAQKGTIWGNGKQVNPADAVTSAGGYNIEPDAGLQRGFLYIDASEQPGNICSVEFQGEFCASDKLMCSGWISGSNTVGSERCPGSVSLTVSGERIEDGEKETIYRFCPGQCYELDNGTGVDGSGGSADKVVWQQFYFEFGTTKKYKRYWLEVNNNCVSSNGGDFMLDNVEVFALVPEVIPEMNTPICVHKDVSEMQLLKLNIGFDKILAATSSTEVTGDGAGVKKDISFVFLEKEKFLTTFLEELNKNPLNYGLANVEELEKKIGKGEYENLITSDEDYKKAYKAAFNVAILGDRTKVWDSDSYIEDDLTAAVLNYHWSTKFTEMESFSFARAVNGQGSVFRETDTDSGERFIVINGNYPNKLPWKTDTDYYVVPYNSKVTTITDALYEDFNLCSACCKKTEFRLDPPIQILSMEASDVTEDLVVCEGKIPTLLTNLKGYNINGKMIPIKGLNFDWWLGNETDLATLDNYHQQKNTAETVRLDEALYILRLYYPDVTSLDGVVPRSSSNTNQSALHSSDPALTQDMIDYLKSLVNAGQLILHQSSISIPAKKADGDNDPYFYLVACPIHDAAFDQALNYDNNKYVAYFCDEPQGLRIKVGEKAPTLKCGFVPNENGFSNYDYSSVNDAVLSIRLAKKAQFENVKHGTITDAAVDDPAAADLNDHFLWLPIRDAEVQSTGSTRVIQKSDDYNVYLSSTDDPIWDKEISKIMNRDKELPIFGKIVKLEAVNKSDANTDQTSNRLCIYFTEYGNTDAEKEKYDVREGYSYTLSLPFKENGSNTCDGTILINVKIVPDYEVWTGGAGNTDWNNDQNWRRADGNLRASIDEPTSESPLNSNELYRTNNLPATSPLAEYTTNSSNYRTAKDRLLRKGFAPLYCTHVLMKSNEWGNAPVLYDALDGANSFTASPFPNLRETSTPILKFDMQARHYEKWSEVYGSNPDKGREGDLIAEMYQINSCDEIAFQPSAELRNAHLLNYNNAWVEYQLDMKRWYLLGSPLQGTIAGEWYAPTGNAQQKTTYYENVTFGLGYDRYSPAIYQRSWDKAKAVLYEVGADYATNDDAQTNENDNASQGSWSTTWQAPTGGADNYLDRLGYKPFGNKKANVAIKGIWSNTYNDAQVDYGTGGFSVMVLNHLKPSGNGNDNPAIIRLPKEDTMYDYYSISQDGSADGGTDTQLSAVQGKNRAKNRGRLKTDLLLPVSNEFSPRKTETTVSRYGDQRSITRVPTKQSDLTTMNGGTFSFTETIPTGATATLGYFLVENPFPCGLDMTKFFETNSGVIEMKYWLLTTAEQGQNPRQVLVQQAPAGEWITQSGNPAAFTAAEAIVAPGQGFFVQAKTAGQDLTITFNKEMLAQTRYGEADDGTPYTIVVGTKQKMKTIQVTYDHDDNPETAEVPLMVDHDDDPSTPEVQATMEVPEVDNLGNYVVDDITETVTIYSYKQTTDNNKKFSLKTRGEATSLPGLVITAKRDNGESSALVMQRSGASNDFLPSEDTEAFITSDFESMPTVYTLCGRLATTINSVHDFRSLGLGVESNSDAPCTLTFKGVEMLGDSIAFYDAVEKMLTPLESGMTISVSGQTQNRYYLVRGLNLKEAAEETHLQIFTEGLMAKVIASTAEPITVVRCFDTSGRLLYTANPDSAEHSFTLPGKGVYIIEAQTESDRKTKKVMTK